ncbi:MAG TPA: hypothetical protein VEP90_01695 [Methylomirabilota bacterium]|nr:hypothetical protein [Methylomirabilota bacterium]
MTKLKKKRNKKWIPEWQKNNVSREDYLLLPYSHLIPKKIEETNEEKVEETAVQI